MTNDKYQWFHQIYILIFYLKLVLPQARYSINMFMLLRDVRECSFSLHDLNEMTIVYLIIICCSFRLINVLACKDSSSFTALVVELDQVLLLCSWRGCLSIMARNPNWSLPSTQHHRYWLRYKKEHVMSMSKHIHTTIKWTFMKDFSMAYLLHTLFGIK